MAEMTYAIDNEKEKILSDATERFNNAVSIFEFEDLKEEFEELGEYKNASEYAVKCAGKISEIQNEKKELDYRYAIKRLHKANIEGNIEEIKELKEVFERCFASYSDAGYYRDLCDKYMEEIKAIKEIRAVNERYVLKEHTEMQNRPAMNKKAANISYEKDLRDSNDVAKWFTVLIVSVFRFPALLLDIFLVPIFLSETEEVPLAVTAVFIIGIIINIVKMGYCTITLFPFWFDFEKKIPLFRIIREIRNIFVQVFLRVGVQLLITAVYYFFASVIIFLALI